MFILHGEAFEGNTTVEITDTSSHPFKQDSFFPLQLDIKIPKTDEEEGKISIRSEYGTTIISSMASDGGDR